MFVAGHCSSARHLPYASLNVHTYPVRDAVRDALERAIPPRVRSCTRLRLPSNIEPCVLDHAVANRHIHAIQA